MDFYISLDLSLSLKAGISGGINPPFNAFLGEVGAGLKFTARTDTHVTDQYTTMAGRRRQHTTDANQTTLSFTKGRSRLDLVVRVSADGLGYRYVVRQSGTVSVSGCSVQMRPPMRSRASSTMTSTSFFARRWAAARPLAPFLKMGIIRRS